MTEVMGRIGNDLQIIRNNSAKADDTLSVYHESSSDEHGDAKAIS